MCATAILLLSYNENLMLYIFDHYLVGFHTFLFLLSEGAWVVNCWKLLTTDHKCNSTDMDFCLNTNLQCYNFQIPLPNGRGFHMSISYNFVCFTLPWSLDWVAQTSIKFKSQLNLKCTLILYALQVNLSVN